MAIALEGSFVTNLPADALSSGRWGDDPRESLQQPVGAVSLARNTAVARSVARRCSAAKRPAVVTRSAHRFVAACRTLLAVCCCWRCGCSLAMSPLLRMSGAASRVSQGSLARVGRSLSRFDRNDELATIGKGLDWAVQRLQSLLHTSKLRARRH